MNDYLNVCMYEYVVEWMYGWIDMCMDGWMFTVVVSLVWEDKLGKKKELLQMRKDILFCPWFQRICLNLAKARIQDCSFQ